MEKKLTLEQFEFQLLNYKKQDIQKKTDIATNIVNQCNQQAATTSNSALVKSSILTGVSTETLKKIKLLERKSIKFREKILEQKQNELYYALPFTRIRQHLINSYTKNFKIPTDLKNNKVYQGVGKFCTPIQIPGTKASIILEKPQTVLERHQYLHTKTQHREANRNIVYIGKINLNVNKGRFFYKEDNLETRTRFIIAVSPKLGYMSYIYCCGNNQSYLTNWMQEKIVPDLPKESVIIFQENVLAHGDETISSRSSKAEMVNWLKSNNIPYEYKMHRAELYKLIKLYEKTSIGQLSQAEQNLNAHGHITIRKKRCNLDVNYFDPFWDFLSQQLTKASQPGVMTNASLKNYSHVITRTANEVIKNLPLTYWMDLEDRLMLKESEIYKEDLEMEYIIDKLMTMVKQEGLPESDVALYQKLDEYNKTFAQEHIFLAASINKLMNYPRPPAPQGARKDII